MKPLSPQHIRELLIDHPEWRLEDKWLARDLKFSDFQVAWRFMNDVADRAAETDHHPNWYNVYSTVQIRLSTHDADGVTHRDFELVRSIDQFLFSVPHTDLPPTPIF